ncbi:hypothetical protein [Prolixibacter sp. NT017]|uniref:hypothetical protein n=1 Tax=Prolixibacter sp. NT017 TaxID=2652390 RepID=UPI00129911D2|nr:hypothetical protein [Prolixibacter sp. NT017]
MKNLKRMKSMLLLSLAICFLFAGCQQSFLDEPQDETGLVLKKGKKITVDPADLYGDLWVIQRDNRGVPVLYPLPYSVEFQDELKEGFIDVTIPYLTASITTPEGDVIVPEGGGFPEWDDVPLLYDSEGGVYEVVGENVQEIEMGRLNLIRSGPEVLDRRLEEVIKNFGDGTVSEVIRDYCGRLFMVRTDAALAQEIEDKPIDSPLENLAIYKELLTNGFQGRLSFLVDNFKMKGRLDNISDWSQSEKGVEFMTLEEKQLFIANVCAACVGAGSDKTGFLTIDEICYLNEFMGIPGDECFYPVITKTVRTLNQTNKNQETVVKKYIDLSAFMYTRQKFWKTFVTIRTIDDSTDPWTYRDLGTYTIHKILKGNAPELDVLLGTYRYTIDSPVKIRMVGFTNQADDYVQALELVHGNEEFMVWQMPSVDRSASPFSYTAEEESHGNRPPGKGDDEELSTDDSGSGSTGSTGSRGGGRRGRR